jgi:predicted adenylyl cyclase CyaB
MPANIEIKARVEDFETLQYTAASLSDAGVQVIPQEDTFFNVPSGRLKLRILSVDLGYLIFYQRPDQEGPKRSDYTLAETQDPASLKLALSQALGVRGVVRKTRYLYMIGQTRVHLDDVEGLGLFVELEVVLRDGQSDTDGQEITATLMQKLGVDPSALIEGAYMDLIEESVSS